MDRKFVIRISLLSALVFALLVSIYVINKESRRGILKVAFLDVGQGDAIFIDSPSGNQILIDGGPSKAVLRELGKVMPFYDRSIDIIIATHPDSDHISVLNDVLEKYRVGLFFEPGVEGDTSIYKELKERVKNKNIKIIEARRGMEVDFGDGVLLKILFPVLDPRGMETNTASIVARLVYGESEFMLTGDSPKNIEDYLVSSFQGQSLELKSDVLKAGHHGSKTSTGEAFVKAVSPQYAVISAGKDNRYGHPHKEVLDTLSKFNIKTLNTAELGPIIFKSDGFSLKLE